VGRSITGGFTTPRAWLCGLVLALGAVAPLAPAVAQQGAAPAAAPAAATPAAPAQAPEAKPFAILEYQVDGNTLLSTMDVEKAVMPHLGETRTIKDIEAARAQLENTYHDRGYKTVLVSIPPQQVQDGVVKLHVTEAAVGKLHVSGSRYHSLDRIKEEVPQLAEGTVPQFADVQTELAEVNRSADMRVTPVLRASETPGKVDVELMVKDSLPVHATLETDNHYSANTAHWRVSGILEYDNLFQRNQSISLQYQTAPSEPDDAKVASVSYVIPLPDNLVLALYGVKSDSNVAAVGDLNVIGKGDIFGARLIAPLPTSSREFYHSFTGGFDWKDLKQNVQVKDPTTGDIQTVESPATYPVFTLQYSATWLGAPFSGGARPATYSGRSSTTFDLATSFTIRGLGTDEQEFADKRAGASDSFITLRPALTREQVLPHAWTLVGRIEGQLASGPLINNEGFVAGGFDSVRGYTEAERLGDNGIRGMLELRTPQLFMQRFSQLERSYFLAFVEGAHLRILEPLPEQIDEYSLASIGLGLRFKAHGFLLSVDGAHILRDGSVTLSGRNRGVVQFSYTY
jgi:hemolysin activation/secretion protein